MPEAAARLTPSERRSLIEQAATRLFAQRGFAATTVDDIVHAAGFTKPMLYRHFESKQELSQAFIESWLSKLKERCIWREEFETLDDAREQIGSYIDRYHHRPHSRLAYKTPREVAAIWQDPDDHLIPAA